MKNRWLSLLLIFVASRSFAGIMIEPYLGYEVTKTSETLAAGIGSLTAGQNVSGGVSGANYGLRLGYKLPLLFWGALDLDLGNATLKFDNSSIPSQTVNRTVLGVTAGVDVPFLIRAWVGYGFSDQAKMTSFSNPGATDTLTGTNTKIGIALNTLPLVSLNLEYIMRTYNSGSGPDFSGGSFNSTLKNATQNTLMFSVSVPFDI